jgi:hypothetical protein
MFRCVMPRRIRKARAEYFPLLFSGFTGCVEPLFERGRFLKGSPKKREMGISRFFLAVASRSGNLATR